MHAAGPRTTTKCTDIMQKESQDSEESKKAGRQGNVKKPDDSSEDGQRQLCWHVKEVGLQEEKTVKSQKKIIKSLGGSILSLVRCEKGIESG